MQRGTNMNCVAMIRAVTRPLQAMTRTAEQLARSVDHVKSVDNEIDVKK